MATASQRGLDQVGAQVVLDRPADDPAGAAVADRAQVQPALPGGQVGDVGGPDPVQLAGVEAAPDQVLGTGGSGSATVVAGTNDAG